MKSVYVLALVLVLCGLCVAEKDSGQCFICKTVFKELAILLNKTENLEEIHKVLRGFCDVLDGKYKEGCYSIADKVKWAISKLPKYIHFDPYNPSSLCSILSFCPVPCCLSPHQPEQVHLTVGDDLSEIYISWTASLAAPKGGQAQVWTGDNSPTVFPATTSTYTFAGWEGQIYVAKVTGLNPGETYSYQVGNPASSMSKTFTYRVKEENANRTTILLIADMGAQEYSDPTRASILSTLDGVDLVLHNGDMSYADGVQHLWDVFMRKMEPITSGIPLMTVPGNHEIPGNFISYRLRFPNPTFKQDTGNENFYHSYNMGPVHIVGMDTEGVMDTPLITDKQLEWLEKDLQAANEARESRPWIVVMGHRPLYCTNKDKMNCIIFADYLQGRLEDLFIKYKVDIVFEAHQHDYERTYPMKKGKLVTTSYESPPAPVYVLNGAAGNREGERGFPVIEPDWVAVNASVKSYGRMNVNHTTFEYSQLDAATNAVIDNFVISK